MTDYSGLLAHYKARQAWYIGVLRVYEGETGAYDEYRRAQLADLINSLDDMIAELEKESIVHISDVTEASHPTILIAMIISCRRIRVNFEEHDSN